MAVTRSWTAPGAAPLVVQVEPRRPSRGEWLWLFCSSLLVAAGLLMVCFAKWQTFSGSEQLVNLNRVSSAAELMPLVEAFPNRAASTQPSAPLPRRTL